MVPRTIFQRRLINDRCNSIVVVVVVAVVIAVVVVTVVITVIVVVGVVVVIVVVKVVAIKSFTGGRSITVSTLLKPKV